MAKSRETALYYDPEGGERAQQVKTVLVCMGARIRNIAAADFAQTVGFALGRAGFAQCADIVEAPEQPMLVLDGLPPNVWMFCCVSCGSKACPCRTRRS